jgi:hypothetical protein
MELSSSPGDSVGLDRRAAGCFRYVVRLPDAISPRFPRIEPEVIVALSISARSTINYH